MIFKVEEEEHIQPDKGGDEQVERGIETRGFLIEHKWLG